MPPVFPALVKTLQAVFLKYRIVPSAALCAARISDAPSCRFILFLLHCLVLNVLNAFRHQRSIQGYVVCVRKILSTCSTPFPTACREAQRYAPTVFPLPQSIVIFVGALIYIISPIDLIPDYLIGLGQIDDAAILGLSLFFLEKELRKYEEWKNGDE